MDDYSRLDAAIGATLRATIRDLRGKDDSLTLVACGLIEDLTGFYVAGAGAGWIDALREGSAEDAEATRV